MSRDPTMRMATAATPGASATPRRAAPVLLPTAAGRPPPTDPGGAGREGGAGPRAHGTPRGVLAVVAAVLVGAAVCTSVLITERQDALGQASRHDAVWRAAQVASEHQALRDAVAAFALPGSGVTREEIQRRLGALAERVAAMREPEGEGSRDPEARSVAGDLASAVAAALPLASEIRGPEDAARLLDLVPGMDGRLARGGATGGGELADAERRDLGRLHRLYSGMVAGLVLCGLGLVGLMLRRERLLRQAHGTLRALTLDLTRASADLEDANAMAHRANAGLHVQNDRFDAALNNMSQGLCMVDGQGRLIVCNRRFAEMFGLAGPARPGLPLREVWQDAVAAGRYPAEMLARIGEEQDALAREGRPHTLLREHPDGPALNVTHRPMADGSWVVTYEDATERRRVEARVAHMAHHDGLTELPNRVLLHERIGEALARLHRQPGASLAVFCLDLDHFKAVNDTLGHHAGDALLRAVAGRLRACAREGDLVARLGGDEFALLQYGAEQPGDAAALAGRVVAALATPFDLDGQRVRVGTSVGIAVAPADGRDADRLLQRADMALYRAKAEGRNGHRFFEPEMDARLEARRAVQSDLHGALARDQFEILYQPVHDLQLDRVRGFEALLRWHHPLRGTVPPADFIPLAEEAGLIVAIGGWVIRRACAEAATWPAGHGVAVNLSAAQFGSHDLAEVVADALARSGLAPDRLELEITETVLLRGTDSVLATLHRLRAIGVRVALDDFGIGYSSLSYLRSFPFNKIKIDQSFVRDMATRADCAAIVESVAHLATNLGMGATAEGVETGEQLGLVRAAGCTEAQGYHFGRPRPGRELFGQEPAERIALPGSVA